MLIFSLKLVLFGITHSAMFALQQKYALDIRQYLTETCGKYRTQWLSQTSGF